MANKSFNEIIESTLIVDYKQTSVGFVETRTDGEYLYNLYWYSSASHLPSTIKQTKLDD